MTRMIVYLLCFAALLSAAWPETLEQRLAEIVAVVGEGNAYIQADDKGQPVLKPLAAFPGWFEARISYLHKDGDVLIDNTIALYVDADGAAYWASRVPSILAPRETPPATAGRDTDIAQAVATSQNVSIAKYSIAHDRAGADVTAVVEVDGKLVERRYRAKLDGETWTITPYEVSTDGSKTETAR